MIIDTVTAFARLICGAGQFADIAPVVVAEQEGHIIGHAHTFVVVVLHFFVKRPKLRRGAGILAGYFSNDLSLVFHNIFQ
jgi:hypothetical protein